MLRACIALGIFGLLAVPGDRAARPAVGVPREGGYVAVYAKPLSPAAAGLTLTLGGVSAVREDGTAAPLTLTMPSYPDPGPPRQRLLAWGFVPAGAYAGLAIKVRSARARTDGEGHDLAVGTDAPAAKLPFLAGPRSALVATVELDVGASRKSADELAPVFVATIPPTLASGLTGAVTSRGTGVVSLFDKVSGQVASAIAVGRAPSAMAIDDLRNRLYVAIGGDDAVATLDLLSRSVLGVVRLRGGDEPVSLGLTPDRRTLLVANAGSSSVTVFDASGPTLVERTRVEVGSGPRYLLVDRAGTRAWVFCADEDRVVALTLPTGALAGSVSSPGGPIRGDFSKDGTRLYVLHAYSAYLDVVDASTLAVTQRVFVGPKSVSIKVDSQTDRIYLGFKGSKSISVYDPAGLLPIDEIRTEGGADFLTIDGQGNNLCVIDSLRGEIRLVRLVGKTVAAQVDLPEPSEVALLGER